MHPSTRLRVQSIPGRFSASAISLGTYGAGAGMRDVTTSNIPLVIKSRACHVTFLRAFVQALDTLSSLGPSHGNGERLDI